MIAIIFLLLIIFLATLIRSTFGFGESLIAVPLLSFFLPLNIVVPLGVLLSVTVAGIVMMQDRQKVDLKSAKWLIIWALPGIPLGLLLLIYSPALWTKGFLGLLILGYSIYALKGRKNKEKGKINPLAWLIGCGVCSGILGGAYGLNGPPLVAYGNSQNWDAKTFRATLQAYFLPISLLTLLGYGYQGLWTPDLGRYYLYTLPVAIPAIYLGRYLNHRLNKKAFLKYVFWGLAIIGLTMIGFNINLLLHR